ncbi:DNA-binding transcriptional regulator, MarR family [Collimonas sp. OK607]|nr:DNA-binding transcriptional regulator, MarR family [Collimonas sp. OK607]
MTVHRVGTSTSGEIAQFSHLDYSQVSRAGAELLESGLVTYVIDKTDKRKSFVSLSAKGKRAIATGIANSMGRQDRLKGVMSPEEYKVFGRLLSSLTQEARAMLAEEKSKKE